MARSDVDHMLKPNPLEISTLAAKILGYQLHIQDLRRQLYNI